MSHQGENNAPQGQNFAFLARLTDDQVPQQIRRSGRDNKEGIRLSNFRGTKSCQPVITQLIQLIAPLPTCRDL